MAEIPAPWAVRRRPGKPYTEIGIKRLRCVRCGKKPGYATWQACADGRAHRVLCAQCDYDLNALTLRWMGHPDAEALLEDYRTSLAREGHFIVYKVDTE